LKTYVVFPPLSLVYDVVNIHVNVDAQLCVNVQEALSQRDDGVSAVLLAGKTLSKYLKEV
jgi:hypothetical protein